jgi:CO/xanthine dehydrogenase Mo-binding subunit
MLACPVDAVQLTDGMCLAQTTPRRRLTFAELVAASEKPLRAHTLYRVSSYPHVTAFTAQVVEVEVDPETGQITLLDVVSAHDVGTILNPLGHQGQIDGGLIQGIGASLMEEMIVTDGQVQNANLGEYKLPTIKDIPPLRTVLVQDPSGPAPFHGKAIGESSITPIAAAIANALYDAVGVRLQELPLTAERVFRALT